ncbi:uncharacterized protein LAESUDRAFT_748264 [Laetiporus sulphureus 93-53]|uniref:Uncharacterized protein n=1 Tax=Laetiporus sulphureus 93-53 TaxID=1314785 RepID=A0A165G1J3_9APHY|nr:uncharacterized protein LAESUDRAFT_748264 [Laetiporus sulphureus 93-53]KZT09705.1 hypothetical protein LAESUDRAFT_748264 [Laetiporus sulphureus 93-53]
MLSDARRRRVESTAFKAQVDAPTVWLSLMVNVEEAIDMRAGRAKRQRADEDGGQERRWSIYCTAIAIEPPVNRIGILQQSLHSTTSVNSNPPVSHRKTVFFFNRRTTEYVRRPPVQCNGRATKNVQSEIGQQRPDLGARCTCAPLTLGTIYFAVQTSSLLSKAPRFHAIPHAFTSAFFLAGWYLQFSMLSFINKTIFNFGARGMGDLYSVLLARRNFLYLSVSYASVKRETKTGLSKSGWICILYHHVRRRPCGRVCTADETETKINYRKKEKKPGLTKRDGSVFCTITSAGETRPTKGEAAVIWEQEREGRERIAGRKIERRTMKGGGMGKLERKEIPEEWTSLKQESTRNEEI